MRNNPLEATAVGIRHLDTSPALVRMLELSHTDVVDVSVLGNCTNLCSLDLTEFERVVDVLALRKCVNLQCFDGIRHLDLPTPEYWAGRNAGSTKGHDCKKAAYLRCWADMHQLLVRGVTPISPVPSSIVRVFQVHVRSKS
jgi:hypothetical protein